MANEIEPRLREIQLYVERNRPRETEGDGVSFASATFKGWLSTLNRQLNPGGRSGDDPAADLVTNALDDLVEGVVRALERAATRPEVVVCCLLNALHLRVGTESRALLKEEWKTQIRALIALLRFVRASSGPQGLNLISYNYDLSNLFEVAIRAVMLGPLVATLHALELALELLGQKLRTEISKTRCAPLVDLWSTVLRWFYAQPFGFVARARAFALSSLTDQKRARDRMTGTPGLNLPGLEGGLTLDVDPEDLDRIIRILVRLLDAEIHLELCPVPTEVGTPYSEEDDDDDGERDDRDDRDDDDGERDDRDDPDTETDGPDAPGQDGPVPESDRGREGRRYGRRTPGGRERSDRRRHAQRDAADPERGAGTLYDLPDGYQPYYDALPAGEWLYLTTANIERLLVSAFGADPEAARGLARGGSCREELSDGARDALLALGVEL